MARGWQTGEPAGGAGLRPPWWINPLFYCLLFFLPLFLATTGAGSDMVKLGQKVNNITPDNILLGLLSIAALAAGSLPFCLGRDRGPPPAGIDADDVNRALVAMGSLSVVCYLIYFSALAANPGLVLQFLSGNSDAMFTVRDNIAQIPGVTSFMNASLPFLSLYGAASLGSAAGIWKVNRRLAVAIAVFTVARGMLASERLAIVEAALAYALPRAAFVWRPGWLRALLPYLGIIGVFGIFCIGEFFRSWQFYKTVYPENFFDFILSRFLAYFSTSINNGAGLVDHYPPFYYPAQTADGYYKLLNIFWPTVSPADKQVDQYLALYASPEFNNPGGMYMPFMDFGIYGGAAYLVLFGAISGLLYRNFLRLSPLAVMLYPSWYVGLLDIIRVWTWGLSRFVPVILIAVLAAALLSHSARRKRWLRSASPPPGLA